MEIFQTDSDIPVTILRAVLRLGLFQQEIFNTGYKCCSSGKVWPVRNHQDCLFLRQRSDSNQWPAITPNLYVLYTRLHSHLNQIHPSCDQNTERFPSVPARISARGRSFVSHSPLEQPRCAASVKTPMVHIQKNIPYLYMHTLCHSLLFAVTLFHFSYLTTLVPFRNTWISTA